MNEIEKAIRELQNHRDSKYVTQVSNDSCKLAISVLGKQIPKKVDRVGNKCPLCKCYLASEPVGDHYCFHCGQAILWED